jgi:hypothetical protein
MAWLGCTRSIINKMRNQSTAAPLCFPSELTLKITRVTQPRRREWGMLKLLRTWRLHTTRYYMLKNLASTTTLNTAGLKSIRLLRTRMYRICVRGWELQGLGGVIHPLRRIGQGIGERRCKGLRHSMAAAHTTRLCGLSRSVHVATKSTFSQP